MFRSYVGWRYEARVLPMLRYLAIPHARFSVDQPPVRPSCLRCLAAVLKVVYSSYLDARFALELD